ncbi:MFS transporter [Streptomyces hydrogenans]|uniref:MFS transporter n=1 Tax=Streptomyces hydrogenans TaxID=1873719 RepID=UPI00345D4D7C
MNMPKGPARSVISTHPVVRRHEDPVLVAVAPSGALLCMGVIYGPAGAYLPELFATRLRYSGAGFSYNLGGVLGGAAAPLIVTALAENCRPAVGGWFMSATALLSLACVLALPETKERDLELVRPGPGPEGEAAPAR